MRGKQRVAILAAVVLFASAAAAQADTMDNLVLLPFGNVNWNISTNPNASPSVAVAIENTVDSSDEIFGGYDLGVAFTTVLGSGKLATTAVANPTSNPVVPDFYTTFPKLGIEPDTGTGTGTFIGNTSSGGGLYSVPTTAVNLVTMEFDSGSETPSVGSIFDVWAKGATSPLGDTDYVDNQGDYFTYGNASGNGLGLANANGNVLLGTVTIQGVPEPSTLALLGVAGAGLAVCALRRIRRRNGQPA